MRKLFLLKTMLLLCALIVGSGSMWAEEVTLKYSGSTTTNMTGNNDAATLGVSATDWSVVGDKGSSNNFPGLNKDGSIRLYYNASGSNTITITSLNSYTISSIDVTYKQDYSNGTITVGGTGITGSGTGLTKTYSINASSFVIGNGNSSNVQVQITSIKITYTSGSNPSISADNVNITYDATGGEIAYTINNPITGGTVSASKDGDWITLGEGTTSPISFTCTANNTANARTATVTLSYTYNTTETVTKDVTITQAGNPNVFDNISNITEVGASYRVKGTVVALNARGFVIGDGTGYVYYYKGSDTGKSLGDKVTISGTTGTYGQIIQFTNSATIAETTSSDYDGTPAATTITAVPDYTTAYHLSDYFKFEGKLTKDGDKYFVSVGESDIQISYPSTTQEEALTTLLNRNVRVKGYFVGYNSNNYFTTMLESVEITEKEDNEILLDETSGSTDYGTPLSVDYLIDDEYNGTLGFTIDKPEIADVTIGTSAITFTPKAVGTAVITFSAPATAIFNAAEDVTFTLTVNAPVGGVTAAPSTTELWKETWDNTDGTGGNDGSWSGAIASNTVVSDQTGWSYENQGGANKCLKVGSGSKKGTATTPAFGEAGNITISFRAGAWDGGSEQTDLILSVTEDGSKLDKTSVSMTKAEFNTFNVKVTGAKATTQLTFAGKNNSNSRFFLDDVVVSKAGATIKAILNGDGYATFCSEYPLDFTDAEGYTAWQITDIDGTTIKFEKVTGPVKGGTGLLLKGDANAEISIKSVDSTNELTANLLEGTLAPTYVAADKYYGLSGKSFVPVNEAGTVPANKALLPAEYVDVTGNARPLTFVFDDGNTTGVADVNRETITNNGSFYNLNGQRVTNPTKGLYIANGKKMVVK